MLSTFYQAKKKAVGGETDMGVKLKTIAPRAIESMAILRRNNFNEAVPLLLTNQHKNCLERMVIGPGK